MWMNQSIIPLSGPPGGDFFPHDFVCFLGSRTLPLIFPSHFLLALKIKSWRLVEILVKAVAIDDCSKLFSGASGVGMHRGIGSAN
jgi:hypothetical protein